MTGNSFVRRVSAIVAALACTSMSAVPASAYGWQGHEAVGAVADKLVAGHAASARVAAILQNLTLEKAGPWADCAKNITSTGRYKGPKIRPGQKYICDVLYDERDRKEMRTFALANWNNCESFLPVDPATHHPFKDDLSRIHRQGCHRLYHFEDVSILTPAYRDGLIGTHPYDLVHAMEAAILKLEGKPVPAPFRFSSDKEALLLLVHYAGDLHQPLHVGCVYLDASGHMLDPDALPLAQGLAIEQNDSTIGGNALLVGSGELHGKWDAVSSPPQSFTLGNILVVPAGERSTWPAVWAEESFANAKLAFKGVTFAAKTARGWPTTLPVDYRMTQKDEIQRGGWRLARLLMAIWPDA